MLSTSPTPASIPDVGPVDRRPVARRRAGRGRAPPFFGRRRPARARSATVGAARGRHRRGWSRRGERHRKRPDTGAGRQPRRQPTRQVTVDRLSDGDRTELRRRRTCSIAPGGDRRSLDLGAEAPCGGLGHRAAPASRSWSSSIARPLGLSAAHGRPAAARVPVPARPWWPLPRQLARLVGHARRVALVVVLGAPWPRRSPGGSSAAPRADARARTLGGARAGRPGRLRPARRALAGRRVLVGHLPGLPGHAGKAAAARVRRRGGAGGRGGRATRPCTTATASTRCRCCWWPTHDGVVRRHFLGEPTATDLWATVAELREPGPPRRCDHGVSLNARDRWADQSGGGCGWCRS